jgi:hypothetical protein
MSLAILTALAITPQPTAAADKVPGERLLPPNVLGYLSIPSVPKLKERCGNSLLGQIRKDEELADFWSDVEAKLDRFSTEAEAKTGVNLRELLTIPSGQLTVAFVQPSGGDPGPVAILDFGENEETVNTLLDKAAEALADRGAERTVQDFEDTQIVVYTMGDDDLDVDLDGEQEERDEPAQQEKRRQVTYFVKDSTIVVSSEVTILESVLARWDGEHGQTFADNEVYNYIVKRCREEDTDSLVIWYVDPIGLLTTVIKSAGQGNFQAQMVLSVLPALGIGNLKAIGGGLDMATEQFDSISRSMMYIESPTSGLLNIFRFPAIQQAPPKWISADVASYFQANWAVGDAYSAVEVLVDTFRGPGSFAEIIDQIANAEDGPNVHLKKDLIDQLTGELHVVSDVDEEEPLGTGRFLVALDTKNADNMKALLAAVAKFPAFPETSREFRGETLYEFPLGAGGLGNPNATMALGVVQGHLAITSDVTMIEQMIRADADQPALVDSEAYRAIAAQFPEKTSMVAFKKQDSQMQAAYEMLRSGQLGLEAFIEGLDFTKLPPFEAIKKYLPPTGGYASPDDYGALFVSFTLKKNGS